MPYSVVTKAPSVGRVEKGVETSVYVTEYAIIIIRDKKCGIREWVIVGVLWMVLDARTCHLLAAGRGAWCHEAVGTVQLCRFA